MTGILSNIMLSWRFLRENFHNGHEGHDNLGSHMVGQPTLRLEKLQFDIAKCTIDSIIII